MPQVCLLVTSEDSRLDDTLASISPELQRASQCLGEASRLLTRCSAHKDVLEPEVWRDLRLLAEEATDVYDRVQSTVRRLEVRWSAESG